MGERTQLRQAELAELENELADMFLQWRYGEIDEFTERQRRRWDRIWRELERRGRHRVQRPDCACAECF